MLSAFHKLKSFYQQKLSYQQDSKNIEKLTRWAMLFIIILDIFVYSAIQLGIEFQTRTLNNPDTKFTYQCRNLADDPNQVKNYQWHQYRFSNKRYTNTNDYIYPSGVTAGSRNVILSIEEKELDARCASFKGHIQTISQTKALKSIKDRITSLSKQQTKNNTDLAYIQNNYNTVLFEKMAGESNDASILEMDLDTKNIKKKYEALQVSIAKTNQELRSLKEAFSSHALVVTFYDEVMKNKTQLKKDYKEMMKRFFLKKAGVIVLFLLPIIGLFYWQMSVQNSKRNYTKYIICKNIFVIAMAFLVINLLPIIYNFIPHVFLEKVLLFFYHLEIPFIAYYILLALGVVGFSYIILRIQNANKNKQKTTITFIENYRANKCEKCGIKVDYALMNYCPNCSNALKMECGHCGKMTIKTFDYCAFCQEKVKKEELI